LFSVVETSLHNRIEAYSPQELAEKIVSLE